MPFYKLNRLRKNSNQQKTLNTLKQDLKQNIDDLSIIFEGEKNEDFVIRTFSIDPLNIDAAIIFMDGVVDKNAIEEFLINPLIRKQQWPTESDEVVEEVLKQTVPLIHLRKVFTLTECIEGINTGQTVLLLNEKELGFLFDTTKVEHRTIDTPKNELTLKGPNEGFVESLSMNKALIRKQLNYEKLVTETVKLKTRATNTVSLMYINDVANQDVVTEVKNRLRAIEVDAIQTISMLEQYIEDRPHSLVPTILYTERPDRAVSYLLEGHVVVLFENSPASLIAPVTFWSFFHTAEDSHHRWAYSIFIRLIRLIALLIALIIPSFYVAATTFHIEMIPTDLALAIAAKRETVPFPAILEVLLMELAFEILREAGIRVPAPIGPTIGIVGALILGQAAVEANIISPIMVIVVSITGLASFAVPDLSFSFMIRIIRFAFLISAFLLGLLGIVICFILCLAYLTNINSFGVPFFSPAAPHNASAGDLLFRRTVKREWIRPTNIESQNPYRKSEGRK